MLILGIHDGKDAGVVLLDGEKILFAANEERYSRRKLHFGFPFWSLEKAFQHTGVRPEDIRAVTVGFQGMVENSEASYDYSAEPRTHQKLYSTLAKSMGPIMNTSMAAFGSLQVLKLLSHNRSELRKYTRRNFGIEAPIHFMHHQHSHAASAYFACGKKEAIVITSDGGGDGGSGGIYLGRNGKIENKTIFSKLNSAGVFWEIITQCCGFNPERHGGKITGLAAYADGKRAYEILSELYTYSNLTGGFHNQSQTAFRDAFRLVQSRTKHLGREEISAGAQLLLDEVFVQTVRDAVERYKISHVALSGGTFANVRTNLKIREIPGVDSVFVFPHMGDGGIALGSACLFHSQREPLPAQEIRDLYWGDEWTESQIRSELQARRGIRWEKLDNPADAVGQALAQKEVIGLFQRRMEFGPRALGHRSILAEPTDTTMIDWLNKRLSRTEFMPFAPIIMEEEAPNYFVDFEDIRYPAQFMTICAHCTPLCKERAPGVVHIDGTARPQTVNASVEPYVYNILASYRDKTGLPLAINTSFNKHEEPIVGTPADAITELLNGAVDVIFLEQYRVKVEGRGS